MAVADHVNETDVTAIIRCIGLPITERPSVCIVERAKVEKWTFHFHFLDYPVRVPTAKR